MKNLLKFGFLGLALTFMVAACNTPAPQEDAQEVEVITEGDVIVEGLEADSVDSTDTIVVVEEEVVAEEAN